MTLRRPPLNVLDTTTIRALADALAALDDARHLKAVVLRSGLDGTFSAGADVGEHARDKAPEMLEAFHALIRRMGALPQTTVAAVDGRCLGGGCELALFCDVVFATPRSTFGQPEIDLACFPPVASAWLTRLAPRAAFEMVLGGAPMDAPAAAAAGLITRVVDDADAAAQEWTERVSAKSAAALALARRALRTGAEGDFDDALRRLEALYLTEVLATEDAEEGVAAFLQKRRPAWRDR
ncbi:MAG TPA: enoyl-CoA hydratase/isomerase family protein [Vicinamibacteria bacterium]|nr:enoyl-CoA hydratase/isomerase family protein [Vicinamibacteria bacterium]